MSAGERVLFIEDNEHAALAGAAMLEICGFDVLHVVTAEEALEVFQARPFDLVLSDIGLPGMNGLQLATTLRRHQPKVRIILATGFSELADKAAQDFIVLNKPYNMSQFRDAVRHTTQHAAG